MARSPSEYFAEIEAQRAINKARAFVTDREPLPLVSRESLRAVLTMDGRPPFIRYDQEGNLACTSARMRCSLRSISPWCISCFG